MPALERITFIDAALNCIIRLEREGDELAELVAEALRLSVGVTDERWQAWRAEALDVRRRQADTSDRW